MSNSDIPTCAKCGVEMELQPYKAPYVSSLGAVIQHSLMDIYICPCCGREYEQMPNDDDGYSAGAGLFSDD